MEIELRFFANFREIAGQKTIHREFDDVSTVGGVTQSLREEYPEMDLYDEDGTVRDFITVMKDGKDVAHLEGTETELEDGDTISVFPPVSGG